MSPSHKGHPYVPRPTPLVYHWMFNCLLSKSLSPSLSLLLGLVSWVPRTMPSTSVTFNMYLLNEWINTCMMQTVNCTIHKVSLDMWLTYNKCNWTSPILEQQGPFHSPTRSSYPQKRQKNHLLLGSTLSSSGHGQLNCVSLIWNSLAFQYFQSHWETLCLLVKIKEK